jgi:hypothetical protein
LPTFARQKRCLTGLTLTNGQTSMHSVNLSMASRLLQSFRLAHLDRSHDAELRHHLKADQSDPIDRQARQRCPGPHKRGPITGFATSGK